MAETVLDVKSSSSSVDFDDSVALKNSTKKRLKNVKTLSNHPSIDKVINWALDRVEMQAIKSK